jgi:hypothetical protein
VNEPKLPPIDFKSFITRGLDSGQILGGLTMIWRLGIVIHVLWVCGFLVSFGLPAPFAKAERVDAILAAQELITLDTKSLRVEALEARMFLLRVDQCKAIANNQSARPFTIELALNVKRYIELAKTTPSLPSCAELL